MNQYLAAFGKYMEEHPLDYGSDSIHSLLEMFFQCYLEINPMETEAMKVLFEKLDRGIPGGLNDEVFDLISGLCMEQGRTAFVEGVRVGGQWMLELSEKRNPLLTTSE